MKGILFFGSVAAFIVIITKVYEHKKPSSKPFKYNYMLDLHGDSIRIKRNDGTHTVVHADSLLEFIYQDHL